MLLNAIVDQKLGLGNAEFVVEVRESGRKCDDQCCGINDSDS